MIDDKEPWLLLDRLWDQIGDDVKQNRVDKGLRRDIEECLGTAE